MNTPKLVAMTGLIAVTLLSPGFAQTLYKSVAPDGKIIYGDKPPDSGRIEKTMKLETAPIRVTSTSAPAPAAAASAPSNSAPAINPIRAQVKLFSAKWCGYCRQAKAYLAANKILYTEFDVDTPAGQTAWGAAGGGSGIPVLVWGSHRIQGFSAAEYNAVLAGKF